MPNAIPDAYKTVPEYTRQMYCHTVHRLITSDARTAQTSGEILVS